MVNGIIPTAEEIRSLTAVDRERLKAEIRAAEIRERTVGAVEKICELTPEQSKRVLCNIAKTTQAKAGESGWQKYVINLIRKEANIE